MISILIVDTQEQKGRTVSITSHGHSSPQVCAAVSALVQATGGFLADMASVTEKDLSVDLRSLDGVFVADAEILTEDPEMHIVIDTIIHMLCYGLISVEASNIADIDVETIIDLEGVVTHQDQVDCIGEWRKTRGIVPDQMPSPSFIDARYQQ